MKVTRFELGSGDVRAHVRPQPEWAPFEDYEGEPLTGVQLDEVHEGPRAEVQLVHIAAGGHFAMHTSPDLAFCQIVKGRGHLRLPDGTDLAYEGPELYLFEPCTLHEWVEIERDTLLSVCLIRRPHEA